MVVAVGLTVCDPVGAVELVQLALHEVALVLVQVMVLLWPEVMVAGVAVKLTVAAGGGGGVLLLSTLFLNHSQKVSVALNA